MCKVSVIVPVFNAASSLRRCLDSILSQTLEDIEIICVDDGSTDGSAAILSEYSGADGRLHVVTFPSQRGVCAARNAGIDAARGEFLGFVDSDDSIRSDFFGLLVARAVETGCDIVKGVIECSDFGSGKPVTPPAGMILDDSIACEKGFFLRGVMYNVSQISDSRLSQKNDINFTTKWERQHDESSPRSSKPRLL